MNNHQYYNVLNSWQSSQIEGAVMIRPLLGKALTSMAVEQAQFKNYTMSISPNPAHEFITIEAEHNLTQIEIYATLGNLIYSSTLFGTNSNISIGTFEPGLYFVRCYDGKNWSNFTKLISEGFYNNMKFHRVIPNFMVQGGCPQGNGTGGSGTKIMCEHRGADKQRHDRGTLSMAHAGPNTGSSQFFICHNRQGTQHLDGQHTAFGTVVEGLDVLDTIGQGDTFSISLI